MRKTQQSGGQEVVVVVVVVVTRFRQLTVAEAHADVVQRHGAAVPEAVAGAEENHLSGEKRSERT